MQCVVKNERVTEIRILKPPKDKSESINFMVFILYTLMAIIGEIKQDEVELHVQKNKYDLRGITELVGMIPMIPIEQVETEAIESYRELQCVLEIGFPAQKSK